MGVVYRARDLSLRRPVAIKFLSAQVADEEPPVRLTGLSSGPVWSPDGKWIAYSGP